MDAAMDYGVKPAGNWAYQKAVDWALGGVLEGMMDYGG
jgi:hypothetical protein